MLVLGINTALAKAEVAITKNGKTIAKEKDLRPFSQASSISNLIENAIKIANIKFDDIDLLSCATGPGSFTGIRIGLAAAKGLEIALEKPLIGINIFEASAHSYPQENLSVLVDSRRNDFFVQEFNRKNNFVSEPFIAEKENLSHLNGSLIYAEEEESIVENICILAQAKYETKIPSPALPLYIRPADVTVCAK